MLADSGQLSVPDVAETLGVSVATVRRDFDVLAERHLLLRTRGGVVSSGGNYDLPVHYKIARQAEAKRKIAAAAASLVEPGHSVALNGGTTTTEVARTLAARHGREGGPGITVVTNALNIAAELVVRASVKIIVTGGTVRPRSYALFGPLSQGAIRQINTDVAFLGVDAVNAEDGATAHHEGEASTDRELSSRARRVVVVADATKVGQRAFALIRRAEEFQALLTDLEPPERVRRAFESAGVQVLVAAEPARV